MSYSLVEEIIGARSRFQRIGDARLCYGWIESSSKDVLFISAPAELPICPGDRFLFQAHTSSATVRFIADLMTEPPKDAPEAQPNEAIYAFKVISRMECLPAMEETRHRIDHRPLEVTRDGQTIPGSLVDVSATGAAVQTQAKFEVGDMVTLSLEDKQRSLTVEAEVKYSFPTKDGIGIYRTGLKLLNCSRLVSAQWRGLLDAA